MVAVAPLLHEIIPHGGSRLALVPPDATISTGYSENPDSGAVFREHLWRFMDDPSALMSLWVHEHPIAYAARVLRESGATPAQTKVGIHLALGKARPEIADELGLQLCSVADHSKKLYQTLDVHNSTELGTKIWLNPHQDEARRMSFFRHRTQEGDLFETSHPIAFMPSPASARMKKRGGDEGTVCAARRCRQGDEENQLQWVPVPTRDRGGCAGCGACITAIIILTLAA
jgi:DNA-binding CsgD family transcriptional regulator